MSLADKVKFVVIAVIALVIIVSVVCLYVYIDNLNDQVSDLNATVENQKSEIDLLNRNIDHLQKNVESLHSSLEITSDYIKSIKQIHSDESIVKQAIYDEVVSDPETNDWYNESLPESITSIIKDYNDKLCQDGI